MPTTQAESDRTIHRKKHIVRAGPHFHTAMSIRLIPSIIANT